MILDIRTILFFTSLNSCITGIGLMAASLSYSDSLRKSMYVMGRGSLLLMAGMLFVVLRESCVSPLFSITAANFFMLWGGGELYQALRIFDGGEPERRWTGTLAVLLTLVNVFFYVVFDILQVRLVVLSLGISVLAGLAGLETLRSSSVPDSRVRITSSLSFWLLAFVFALRAGGTFFPDGNPAGIFENSVWQTFIYALASIGFTLMNFSFLLLCNDQFNHHLGQLALTDPLTGLFNRRAFTDMALREMACSSRSGEPLSLIMIDADGFKNINDTYGHAGGDRVLQHIAALIKEKVRPHDVVGRLGGDEFAVLLPGADHATALGVEERLVTAAMEYPAPFKEWKIPLEISAGSASLNLISPDFDDLLSRADDALYRAKGQRQ